MRVLITGSRTWTGKRAEARINIILSILAALCEVLGTKLTVVHGACPEGADAITDAWLVRHEDAGVHAERHPADWDQYGKAAGPLRNSEMVTLGADLCIGFLREGSRGTSHTLALARSAGIPTFTVSWEDA